MDSETANKICSLDSNQKIFDYVVNFMSSQGKPSIDAAGDCVYYGPNNLRCAVGCLILPDEYKSSFDENQEDIGKLTDSIPRFEGYEDILSRLQYFHDDMEHWADTCGLLSSSENDSPFSVSGKNYLNKIALELNLNCLLD